MICKIRMAAAAVIGRSHEVVGGACQDRAEFSRGRTVAVIALGDGAGSATHSELGAQTVVSTTTKLLRANFHELCQQDSRYISDFIVKRIHKSLKRHVTDASIELGDLAATLLFVATDGKNYLCGQIGDGRIARFSNNINESSLVFHPHKGEFINETIFVTHPNAAHHMKIEMGSISEIGGFALMSDGAEESLFNRAENKFATGLAKMMSWFDSNSERMVQKALNENLYVVMRNKTMDDLSLAMMRVHAST